MTDYARPNGDNRMNLKSQAGEGIPSAEFDAEWNGLVTEVNKMLHKDGSESMTGILTTAGTKQGVLSKTSSYTILDADYFDLMRITASSNITITMPAAASHANRRLFFSRIDTDYATYTVTVGGIALTSQTLELRSDGSSWLQVTPAPRPMVTISGTTGALATNAALGDFFNIAALTGNITLSAPTNPTDGQAVLWRIKQSSGGSNTLTLATGAGAFTLGSNIANTTISVTANTYSYLGAIYNLTQNRWNVVAFDTNFA